MNKKSLIIGILLSAFIFTVPAANFTKAQVPNVPKPTCDPVPKIPCPSDWKVNIVPEKQQPSSKSPSNFSKSFNDLLKIAGVYTDKIIDAIKSGFIEIKDIFDKFFYKFF